MQFAAKSVVAAFAASTLAEAANVSTASKPSSTPRAIMRLAQIKGFNPADIKHLDPSKNQTYHFVGQSETDPVAKADLSFRGKTVTLSDSSLVSSLKCNGTHMTIVFTTDKAFDTVQSTWPSGGEDFYLVTYNKQCGGANSQHYVTEITDTTLDKTTRTVVADYIEVDMGKAIDEGAISWGRVTADQQQLVVADTSNTTSSSITATSPTNTPSEKLVIPPVYKGPGFLRSKHSPQDDAQQKMIAAKRHKVRRTVTPTDKTTAVTRNKLGARQFTAPSPVNDPSFGAGVGFPSAGGDPTVCLPAPADIDESALDGPAFDLTDPTQQLPDINAMLPNDQVTAITSRRARQARRALIARAQLSKRQWSLWGAIDEACSFLRDVPVAWAEGVYEAAFSAVEGTARAAIDALQAAGDLLVSGQRTFNPINTALVFNYPSPETLADYGLTAIDPTTLANDFPNSQQGFLITSYTSTDGKSSAQLYCIDCGVSGNLHFDGQVTFNTYEGVTAATLTVDGAMDVGFQVGLNANGEWKSTPSDQELFKVRLGSGIYIPGIIDFHPALTATAKIGVQLTGSAEMTAGVQLKWPAISTNLDLVAGTAGKSGWAPQITKIFSANVDMTVDAKIDFPVTFGLAMDILSGTWTHAVALVEHPTLELIAGINANLDINGVTSVGTAACSGIPVELQFANNLYFSGLPTSTGQVSVWEVETTSLYQDCLLASNPYMDIVPAPLSEVEASAVNPASGLATVTTSTSKRQAGTDPHAVAAPDSADFRTNIIMDPFDLTYLATTPNGLVILDSYKRTTTCVEPGNFLFEPVSEAVVGVSSASGTDLLLHMYSNELASYGASRLRAHPATALPETAEVVFLKSNQEGDLFGLIPGDTSFTPYFLIACQAVDQPTTLFVSQLGKNSDGSIDYTIMTNFLESTTGANVLLPGATVSKCSLKNLRMTSLDQVKAGFVATDASATGTDSPLASNSVLPEDAPGNEFQDVPFNTAAPFATVIATATAVAS